MRRGKRIVAVFLSVCFAINISISGLDIRAEEMTGITATATDAENEQQDTTYLNTDDIEIESQDSVGEMLAEDLESVYAEQEENSGYNIFNIDVKDRIATVQYEALENATLVVSAYDETTNQMVASASKSVNKDETAVDLELGDLPQYYILKGFIVDSETLQPLTKEFKSELYTQGMQEFLQKTTDDFSEDRVLNFDDDKSNNFAVYNQNTMVIEQEATKNQLISADAEKNIYVFENVDTNMLSLQKDDVLSYEKEDGMVLIVKVSTIDVEGTTVTISGQNADTEDVFDYVKIDSEAGMENVTIDNSNLEDGVEYTGMIEDSADVPKTYSENANDSQTDALVANESEVGASNGEGSNKLSAEFKLENPKNKDDEEISASVSGKVNIELKNSIKLYIAQDRQYVEVKFDYSLGLNISIKMEVDAKIPLGKFSFAPIPGLKIGLTPNVVLKVSGKLSLEGKLKGCIGVRISAQEGITNLTSNPKWSGNIKFEATLFIGISLKPEIDLINEKVVELSFEGEVGAEIKSTQEVISSSKSVRHECKSCLDGEISGKESATFKAKFLNLKGATFARTFEINQKLTDFYYSFDYDEFAFTECPHKTYAVTVLALDKEKNPIKDAVISCNSTKYQTDENGKAKFYIAAGTYTISAAKQGVGSYSKILRVYDESKTIEIQIKGNNSGSSEEKKGIKIGSNTFPDEKFRAYILKNIDKDGDGYLSETEIAETTSITCRARSISSLKGIECFAALEYLYCSENNLTQLDVSKNTALEALDCLKNNLTQLDVSKNTALEALYCFENNLTQLDVSKNTALEDLDCSGNNLTQLDVSKNAKLCELKCYNNNISQLDVSNKSNLRILSCDRNVQVTGYNGTITYPDSSTSENRLDEESQPVTDDFSDFEMKEVYKTDNPISAKTVQQVTKADDTHVSYIGLYPNTIYNLYVCKQAPVSIPFTEVFTEHNLLYINQYESDSDGNLSIDYVPMQEAAGAVEILVAEKRINITDDARVCMADIKYDGETHSPLIEYYFSDSLLSEGIDYEIEGDYEAKEPGTYTIRIRGIGQYTGTLELQYKIIDTTPVVTKPTPVKDLKAVPVSKNEVKLTWTATEKDVKYLIYAKKHGKYEYCGTTSSTSYTDTDALCDDFGYYWVYPCRTDENGEDIIGDCPQYVCAKGVYEEITEEKTANVTISYRTHVQSFGWQNPVTNGVMSGTTGKAKRLEGIEISVSGNKNLGIQYATHCQTYGWLPWSANGEMSGTTGEAKRLEAIEIRLTGADKDKYDVYYRVHAQSYGWLGWAKNGEPSGTAGYAKRLEGIQIVVVKKTEAAPGLDYAGVNASKGVHDSRAYIAKTNGTITIPGSADSTNIMYKTHVQSFGWQNWVLNGTMSGTSGKAKRLEGINIKLSNAAYAGGIQYQTHIQKNGWEQKWKKDGEMSGTSGEAKRLEAIRIKLYGEMANRFDVYYRVHAQSYGWLGWAKNGEESGTAGLAKRLEGIQIVLVPKGSAAPANNYKNIQSVNTKAYIKK